MRRLRRLHIITGLVLGPFIVITAVTGLMIMLFNRFYELLNVHSWFRWGGVALGLGLIFLVITGAVVFIKTERQKKKRKNPPQASILG
jgi:uncharacterized iron-regulated membrane protein